MTQTPDEPDEPDDVGPSGRDQGSPRKLDEDAAWRAIVENYGDRPAIEDGEPRTEPPAGPPLDPEHGREERLRGLFQPSWNDPLDAEDTSAEAHFVPPPPPPVPRPEPRRRVAWSGLFGAPTVMLVAVVLGWTLPSWATAGLAACFVGGFVYLVATMPNRRPGEGPGGGNGAVV